jgi:hypothetical protein
MRTAFNRGIKWAIDQGFEWLCLFSSDIIADRDLMHKMWGYLPKFETHCVHARAHEPGNNGYSPDGEFCSSKVIRPLGWFWGTHVDNITRAELKPGQYYDERFLNGFAYEDGDFTGRVACATGRVIIDDRLTVEHQHHTTDQPGSGHRHNSQLAARRWGHAEPWDTKRVPWSIISSAEGWVELKIDGGPSGINTQNVK